MKKTLSIFLVVAMLICMIPAFGAFAAAAATIDTADDFIAFADALNAGTWTGGDVTVGADLNFAGKTYTPIGNLTVNIDFGGHTVKNLKVNTTVDALPADDAFNAVAYKNWHGAYSGLVAHYLKGGKALKNVTFKDCELNVTLADGVAAVDVGLVGTSDRGYMENVSVDGLAITTNTTGKVGTYAGCQMWNYNEGTDVALTDGKIDVSVDAANANVGLLVGCANENFDYALSNVTVTADIAAAANVVTETTVAASGTVNPESTAENTTVTVGGDGVDAEEAAIEASLETIDTPAELALLASRLNEKGTEYKAGATIKVTADLDMAGVDYTPMAEAKFVLDFDGHTVSNLEVTTEGVSMDGSTVAGLLANTLSNDPKGQILNVTLKNCKLTTTAAIAGGVVGGANRGSVDNVTLENVTIIADAATHAGSVIGKKWWGCAHPDMNATLKNVTIDVAETTVVGILIGTMNGMTDYGEPKLNVTGLTVNGLEVKDATVAADALVGTNNVVIGTAAAAEGVTKESLITIAETAVIAVDLDADGTVDYDGPDAPTTNPPATTDAPATTDTPATTTAPTTTAPTTTAPATTGGSTGGDGDDVPPTGDAMVYGVILCVIALAAIAVFSKKRANG